MIPHLTATPRVAILDGVAATTGRSGEVLIEQAMSVRMLANLRDRIDKALQRYANGEQDIIEDG